jgi:hypothetical protein
MRGRLDARGHARGSPAPKIGAAVEPYGLPFAGTVTAQGVLHMAAKFA